MNPVLGGRPILKYPKEAFETCQNIEKYKVLSNMPEYLLSSFVPWHENETGLIESEFLICNEGLLQLLLKWNNSKASEINKQRCRMIQNIPSKKQYTNKHKETSSLWRGRNADW